MSPRLPFRPHRAPRADPDAPFLRRVGWQLAALTAGLLCALLVILGGAVYLTTQQLLQGSLESTLKDRATHPPAYVLGLIQTDSVAPPNDLFNHYPDPSGVFFTAYDTQLAVLGGTGPSNPPLADNGQAATALRSGATACCDLVSFHGQAFLVYSVAVVTPDGAVAGVVQASISAQQYQETMRTIVRVLLAVVALGLIAAAAISALLVRRSLRPIQRALRRQRDFVADAAHELRTPLTIMRTAAELGLGHESLGEQQRALEQTLEQNAHLTRLVDALSLLARADSGVVQLDRQVVDVGQLAHEVATGVAVLADERGIALRVEATPEIRVLGDAGRLRQLLLILLDNALKYTPGGGGIRIAVGRLAGTVRILVEDSGPGIAQEDLPHLFERFYRADQARTGEGTGLGLAIGRWIAEAHGGRIVAANAATGGAVFTVSLPASA